jgi:hypothetical protein
MSASHPAARRAACSTLAGAFAVLLAATAAQAQPIVMQNSPTLGVALNPLCPPWNTALLEGAIDYQGPDMQSGQPYTLQVTVKPAARASLQAYVNYLHSLNPAITTITLGFAIFPVGSGPEPAPSPGAQVGPSNYLTWTAGGNGPSGSTNFFPPGVMNQGTWYLVESRVFLTDGTAYFPGACERQTTVYRVNAGTSQNSGSPMGMRQRPVQSPARPPAAPAARPAR